MTDETTSLVLEHLRHMRQQIGRVEQKVDTLIVRIGLIERHVAITMSVRRPKTPNMIASTNASTVLNAALNWPKAKPPIEIMRRA